MRDMHIGLVGTYPPTRCGIASFTESLAQALNGEPSTSCSVVRVVDGEVARRDARFGRGPKIVAHLHNGDPNSIRSVARVLERDCDAVIVQHEYGIYGGPDGDEVLELLNRLRLPTIVVLHTVLEDPTPSQRRVLEELCSLSTLVVVMSPYAREVLLAEYEVDPSRIHRIPHGTFAAPAVDPRSVTETRESVPTMLTWGLIGPGKGIEWGIMALALMRKVMPDLRYVVAGQTHPKVVAREGESYRAMLDRLIEALELGDRVELIDRYLDRDELAAIVANAAVVVLPYDSRQQVTSGVLAEAVAARKQIVATPFPHAVELVGEDIGVLVDHQDPRAIADAVTRLVARPLASARAGAGPDRADQPTWSSVARLYRSMIQSTVASRTA